MAKQIIEKHASDNKYLHQDFHINCDQGLQYLAQTFGPAAIDEYLSLVARRYFKPLIEKIRIDGLQALQDYFLDLYEREEASDALTMSLSERELHVQLSYCPAVRYMLNKGYTPCSYYRATTDVLYRYIAAYSGLQFVLNKYEEETGAAEFSFSIPN